MQRLRIALFDALAIEIHEAQAVLGVRIALLGQTFQAQIISRVMSSRGMSNRGAGIGKRHGQASMVSVRDDAGAASAIRRFCSCSTPMKLPSEMGRWYK